MHRQKRVKSPRQRAAFKQAANNRAPAGRLRQDPCSVVLIGPGQRPRLEGGDWDRLPSPGTRSRRGSARRSTPSPSPTRFRHSSRSAPLPHHVTAARTRGLFFPCAQPHRARAAEPIHSNCVTMSPGPLRLRELPGSDRAPVAPEGGCAALGFPLSPAGPHRGPTSGPPPTRGELKSNFPEQPRRRVGRFPGPGPPRIRTRPGRPPRYPARSKVLTNSSPPPPPSPPRSPRRAAAKPR